MLSVLLLQEEAIQEDTNYLEVADVITVFNLCVAARTSMNVVATVAAYFAKHIRVV